MATIVTLELPDHVLRSARKMAARTQRRIEEVFVDWMEKAATDVAVETLSDAELLPWCEMQLLPETRTP